MGMKKRDPKTMTDDEIHDLRAAAAKCVFGAVHKTADELGVNDEFIAFALLSYCGAFLGGVISREDARKIFWQAFAMGEKISGGAI